MSIDKSNGVQVVDSTKLTVAQMKELDHVVKTSMSDKFLGSDENEVLREGERRLVILYGPDQEVIGFLSPKRQSSKGINHWRAGALFILSKYRGKGIMFSVLEEFFEKHQPGISWIDDQNHASIGLFKKLGFETDKQRSHDGHDGHWYVKKKENNTHLPASSKW